MLPLENVKAMATMENKYVLCANDKANDLYQNSIDSLTGSECSDYMVYDLKSVNKGDLDDIMQWDVNMEIDEGTYRILHLDLCKKHRKEIRKRRRIVSLRAEDDSL
ncbi:hypothetical protein [Sinomicrobium sp. M5D2P9]